MARVLQSLWIAVLSAALCVPASAAPQQSSKDASNQSGQPSAPLPPIASPESGKAADQSQETKPQEPVPAIRTEPQAITGAVGPTLGSLSDTHSQLLTGLSFGELIDTNAFIINTPPHLEAVTNLGGQLALQQFHAHSQLAFGYAGGGVIYSQEPKLNTSYHEAGVSETITLRRWSLLFAEQFSFLPESEFGLVGPGIAGIGNANVALPALRLPNPAFTPNQSIYTPYTKRIANAVVAQALYQLNARSSLTMTGSYGLLNFLDRGFLNPRNTSLEVGYNYELSVANMVAVSYHTNLYRFGASKASINDNAIIFSYAHRMGTRWIFNAGGGPGYDTYGHTIGSTSNSQMFWNLNTGFSFQGERTGAQVSYAHGVSGGAGVLFGAEADTVRFQSEHQLSRMWTASTEVGFGLNRTLPGTTRAGPSFSFKSWYAGAGLTRQLGRSANFTLHYSLQRQSSNDPQCVAPTCTGNFTRHLVSIGFNWQMHPISLE